jgi:hypothetical protein
MSKWQPISTAPKTGKKILLADYSGYATKGDHGMWIATGHWVLDLSLIGGHWTDGVEKLYTPTNWMPLPEPPEDTR